MLLGNKGIQGNIVGNKGTRNPWEALKTTFNFQLKVPVYIFLLDSAYSEVISSTDNTLTVIKINILRLYGDITGKNSMFCFDRLLLL